MNVLKNYDFICSFFLIVVGFNMSRYVLVERNEPYPLRVSVLKGFLPQSITLGVVTTPGTASK